MEDKIVPQAPQESNPPDPTYPKTGSFDLPAAPARSGHGPARGKVRKPGTSKGRQPKAGSSGAKTK